MKKSFLAIAVVAGLLYGGGVKAAEVWSRVSPDAAPQNLQIMHPNSFLVYKLDETLLRTQLFALSSSPSDAVIFSLPMPDGSSRSFKVWESPVMPGQLAAKFADIKTFSAQAVDAPGVTAKLDFTLYGFHAMIFDGDNTAFIDPYDNYNDGFYMVHYKKEETKAYNERMQCSAHRIDAIGPEGESMEIVDKKTSGAAYKTINGYQLRTYRLALSANSFYCQAATGLSTPTIAQALSKMTTTLNRINGIYEREFSVHFNFVANEDQIIWPTATGSTNGADPFSAINANASSCITKNQTTCDTRIGAASYDVGHVFTTGAGGLSLLGIVCRTGLKAQSVTGSPAPTGDGFDVDYVAHEMGHSFGGEHPFNNGTDGSCGGDNRNQPTAYEPGSGSTIMAYAGICGPDNLQPHSDAYFHTVSLDQMLTYMNGTGNSCAAKTATGNKLVQYAPFAATYSIPYLTPFELIGPTLTDSLADSAVLYCWEQFDRGNNDVANEGLDFKDTYATGPIFRSYSPVSSPKRIFPKLTMVLSGTLSNAGTNNAQGEKAPDVARVLNFKCTFRNIRDNYGCVTIPDDKITLNAINTGAGFKVTSQGTVGTSYAGGSTQTVTWNVVGTNAAPISATTVDIYLSMDGGNNWAYFLGKFPNTGSASVTIPNPAATSTTCRIKVKGTGNVFFNVNGSTFAVTNNADAPITAGVQQVAAIENDAAVYPIPATDLLHITSAGIQTMVVYNTLGQQVWNGQMDKQADVPVANWARGSYYIRLTDGNNQTKVKRFVLE